jgi:hypothetical protein
MTENIKERSKKEEHLEHLNQNKLKYVLIGDVENNLIICDYPCSIPLDVNIIVYVRFLKMVELYSKK